MTSNVTTIRRDRFGRPYIKRPDGREVAYTRATTVAETLDDRFNLELWKMRQVATGLAARPDLVALAAAKRDDKPALDRVCQDAVDAAAAGAAANRGSALHGFVEQINRGEEPWGVPASMQADLDAYRAAMIDWDVLWCEQMVVLDEQSIAGTPDIIARNRKTKKVHVVDLKTGAGAVTYGQTSIAVQLAIYAHGTIYHLETGDREPLQVDQETAVVIHLPAETGKCTLFDVDIAAGWEAAQHALWVRQWRKNRNLFTAHSFTEMEQQIDGAVLLTEAITAAASIEELRQVYSTAVAAGTDPALVLKLCQPRLDEFAAA